MSQQELVTNKLVSAINDSVVSIQQTMNDIVRLSKNCEVNMDMMDELQQKNLDNLDSIGKMKDDVQNQLASIQTNLRKITQTFQQYPSRSHSLERYVCRPILIAPALQSKVPANEININVINTNGQNKEPSQAKPQNSDTESPGVRAAIRKTTGCVLSPDKLKQFLDAVKQKKRPCDVADRFTTNYRSLICQLKDLLYYLKLIPLSKDADRRLELRLPTLITNLQEG